MKVLLAVDDSKYSQAAIRSVLKKAHPQDTEVRVLHVLEPILEAQWSSHHVYGEMMAQRHQDAIEMVKHVAESLKAVGFKTCSCAVENGIPKVVIIEDAKDWGADLIVVGSHGRTGLDRFLLGSVAEAVARHAACSVEIVRGA